MVVLVLVVLFVVAVLVAGGGGCAGSQWWFLGGVQQCWVVDDGCWVMVAASFWAPAGGWRGIKMIKLKIQRLFPIQKFELRFGVFGFQFKFLN